MTRIMFQWLLIFIEGGILLFASGESPVSAIAEEKTSSPNKSLILSLEENSSARIDTSSVSATSEHPPKEDNLDSTLPFLERDESSKTSNFTSNTENDNLISSEDLSTEISTTLLQTESSDEISYDTDSYNFTKVDFGGYEHQEDTASVSGTNFKDAKESQLNVTGETLISPSSEWAESLTKANELNTTNMASSVSDSSSVGNGNTQLETDSEQPGDSKPTSATIRSTRKRSPTDTSLLDTISPMKTSGNWNTDSGMTKEDTTSSGTQTSGEDTKQSAFSFAESTTYLENNSKPENDIVTISVLTTSKGDLSPNIMSLEKTTPKSATRKRSVNSTDDSKPFDETTPTSDYFSSTSHQNELTLTDHSSFPVPTSMGDVVSSTEVGNINSATAFSRGTIIPDASDQSTSLKSMEIQPAGKSNGTASVPSVSSELEREENTEEYTVVPLNQQLNFTDSIEKKHMSSDSIITTFHSESPTNTPKLFQDDSNLNRVEHMDDVPIGVTFDPDGMTHTGPQDPDSIVFYVPSESTNRVSTPQIVYHTGGKEINTNAESETDFVLVKNNNLNGASYSGNGTLEFERMENFPRDNGTESPSLPALLPIDAPEMETFKPDNHSATFVLPPGFTFWDPSKSGWILPETQTETDSDKDLEVNNESEEMLQDAPHFPEVGAPQSNPLNSFEKSKITATEKSQSSLHNGGIISNSNKDLETAVTEIGMVESSSSFLSHQTDQSVIRPVKIISASPAVDAASTSILTDSFSTQETEQSSVQKLSEPTAGFTTAVSESKGNSSPDTSSPIILPNPAPILTEVDKQSELSTMVMQPELVPSSLDKNVTVVTGPSNITSTANSTIAGIAVKTSVSVSLPLSKTKNENQTSQPISDDSGKNSSGDSSVSMTIPASTAQKNDNSDAPADPSTDGLTLTPPSVQTTTVAVSRIRKPKLKITGGSEPFTARPARPFTPSLKRPSSTSGPPVSIFKKTRTRIASITSSTTARPLGQFSTIRIHYASRIPGMVPGGELIISTDPVTTVPTTTTTTTTEMPISEVPFTDQTHIPTVSNEDDVTLIKVAGYIVLDRGFRWNDQLHNRHSAEYKKKADMMHLYLERMFRSSPIAHRLWKVEIDGFSGDKNSRPVAVDFFLYLIKSENDIATDHLAKVFHDKLSSNNTFGTFRVDPAKTAFEMLQEEPLKQPTLAPEEDNVEPPIPQWAIAVIVIGAASLIFIVLFAAVTLYGRHHMRRRYSSKLNEEDMERSSGEWESKMAAAYENMAADTIYDAEDLQSDTYKKSYILD